LGDSSGNWENLGTLKDTGEEVHICDNCRMTPALWRGTMIPDWNISDDEQYYE
jgi:hypothetical protein